MKLDIAVMVAKYALVKSMNLLLSLALLSSFAFAHEAAMDFWRPIKPSPSTTIPDKVSDAYWNSEYLRVNKEVANAKDASLVFFGDSITLAWSIGNAPCKAAWDQYFSAYRPINMGNSGDITPVMLYRLTKGNLDFPKGQEPRVAVLLCGTNNYVVKQSDGGKELWDLGIDTPPSDVADGILAVAQTFRRKLPHTRLILLGILPVKDQKKWEKCRETNRILACHRYPADEVVFMDLADQFIDQESGLKAGLFTDGTHLTARGYELIAKAISPQIKKWIEVQP